MRPSAGARQLGITVREIVQETKQKVRSKAYTIQNEMRNIEIQTLTNASPSPPGSPPGIRTGMLRGTWTFGVEGGGDSFTVFGEPQMHYAGYLDNGTRKMAARPFSDKILEESAAKAVSILSSL